MHQKVIVRKYDPRDRDAIRHISVATALAGEPAVKFIDGDDILADALTMYYTDFEPESCFVVEKGGRVLGYLIGCVDTRRMDKIFGKKIMARIIINAFQTGFLLKKKNLALIWHGFISLCCGEFFSPDFSKGFPATLHINLLPEARGHGNGSTLISEYLSYLSNMRVKGVRMATISTEAGKFFQRHGFKILFKGHRSYLHHIIGKDLPLLIVGKELSS